jgi:hypothetical protein
MSPAVPDELRVRRLVGLAELIDDQLRRLAGLFGPALDDLR